MPRAQEGHCWDGLAASWLADHLCQPAPACAGCPSLAHPRPAAPQRRLSSLPLTLADLSGPSHIPAYTLGRHYVMLCRLLDLQPPLLLAPQLLPRCLDRVAAPAVRDGVLTAAQVTALRRDASALLGWMSSQMARQAYPLAAVGAALVLAAEMNTVRAVSAAGPGPASRRAAGRCCLLAVGPSVVWVAVWVAVWVGGRGAGTGAGFCCCTRCSSEARMTAARRMCAHRPGPPPDGPAC